MYDFDKFLEEHDNQKSATPAQISDAHAKQESAFVVNEINKNANEMANADFSDTAEETFERETGINPNESLWDEVVAVATGFGRGASLGLVSQDDNPIVQSAQELSPIVDASADAIGSVATTLATAGMTSGVTGVGAIQKATSLNTVISSALSRGLIFGQTGATRNIVDVAKGKKDTAQALKDTGAGMFASMFSVIPEAIGGPKMMQLFYQPAGGLLVDWGTRRLLDEYPTEEIKNNEGSVENFIRTYGFNIALDMGFAMLDVNDVSFRSTQKQIRRELAAMAAHPRTKSSYKVIEDKPRGLNALERVAKQMEVETITDLDRVYQLKADELGISVEQLKADVEKQNSEYDNIVNTYGKANKIPEAIKRAEEYGKERQEARDNIEEVESEVIQRDNPIPDKEVETKVEVDTEATDATKNTQETEVVESDNTYTNPEDTYNKLYEQYNETSIANLKTKLNRKNNPIVGEEKVFIEKLIKTKEDFAAAEKVRIQEEKDQKIKAREEKKAADAAEKKRVAEEREAAKETKRVEAETKYKERQEELISNAKSEAQLKNIENRHKTKGMTDVFTESVAKKRKELQDNINKTTEEKAVAAQEKAAAAAEKKAIADKEKAEKESQRVIDKEAKDKKTADDYVEAQTKLINTRTTLTQLKNMEAIYKKKGMTDRLSEQLAAKRKEITEATNKKKAEKDAKITAKKKAADEKAAKKKAAEEKAAEEKAAEDMDAEETPSSKKTTKPKKPTNKPEKDAKLEELKHKLDVAKSKDDAEGIQKAAKELRDNGYERVNREWVKTEAKAETETEAKAETETETETETKTKFEAKFEAKAKTEIEEMSDTEFKKKYVRGFDASRYSPEVRRLILKRAEDIHWNKGGLYIDDINNMLVDGARLNRETFEFAAPEKFMEKYGDDIANLRDELNKLFGTDVKVAVTAMGVNANGWYRTGTDVITLNAPYIKNLAELTSLMTHEYGHFLHKTVIENTARNKDVIAAYNEALGKYDTVGDFVDNETSPSRQDVGSSVPEKMAMRPSENRYYSSLNEWVAEQVNVFMHTDKVAKTKVEKIFKKAADTIKKLMKAALGKYDKNNLDETIEGVLKDIISGKVDISKSTLESVAPKADTEVLESRGHRKKNRDRRERDSRNDKRRARRNRRSKGGDSEEVPEGSVRQEEDSFFNSTDLADIVAENSGVARAMSKIVKKAVDNANGGAITRENNQVLVDNLAVVLRYADEKSLNQKMKALKKASESLTSAFKTGLKGELSDNPEYTGYLKEYNARNPEMRNKKYDPEKLASAYIGNANEFQYKHPELFKIVDDAVKLNVNGTRDDFINYSVSKMLENSDETTVKQTQEFSDQINRDNAKDSNETKQYAEDVSIDDAVHQSAEEAYDIRSGKNQRAIGKEAGLKSRSMIEKLNAFFDTAYGFRYYAARISKALGSSTDDATVKAIKKLQDTAEKDVRSADYVEIKVDSYMKDMENKVLANLSAGEEHPFKMFMLMKSILNDKNMPDDFEMRVGEASITKDSAESWLDNIDPGMEAKFERISEEMHSVRKDWIIESMESSGVFSKEYTDFMKDNSSYVHISMINKDMKSYENDFTLDHVGNAFKVVKSKNYYKQGVLEDVLTSTIKQDVAILHAMENNRRKLDVVGSLTGIKALDSDADISSKAKLSDVMDELVKVVMPNNMNQVRAASEKGKWIDFTYDDVEIDGMTPVEYYENGIKRKVMIDKSVESVFKDKDVNEMFNTVSQNKITTAIRSLYTTRNAGFVVFNYISDMIGTAVRVSPKTLLKYPTAMRQAWKSVHGTEIDGVYKDLAKNGALFGAGNFRNLRKQNMRLVSYLKNNGGIKKKPHEKLFSGFERFSGFIDNINTTVERTSKFAAALHLKEKGYSDKDVAHITREYAGSPNFMTGGYKFKTINNLFMFANPILRGYHQFSDSIFKSDNFTRGAVLSMLGLKVSTDIMSRLLDEGPTDEEITQNGVHIPMGYSVDSSGAYMRSYYAKFPIDRTISDIGGLASLSIMQLMKAFDNDDGTRGDATKVLKGIFNQAPSLSPLLTSMLDAKEYATTGNITNSFGYKILTRDEEYGSHADKSGKVAKHFITSLGGQALLGKTLVNAATGQKKARLKEQGFKDKESEYVDHMDFLGGTAAVSAIRDAGGLPIVGAIAGRFFKGSNYGTVESYRNVIDDARGAKANERVNVTKAVENFLDNDYTDDDLISIFTYPGELSRILTGYGGDNPLVKALSKVPKHDKETRYKILETWKQKRE